MRRVAKVQAIARLLLHPARTGAAGASRRPALAPWGEGGARPAAARGGARPRVRDGLVLRNVKSDPAERSGSHGSSRR